MTQFLAKMRSFGIVGKLLVWFEAHLTERIQCVRINNGSSDFMPVMYIWSATGQHPRTHSVWVINLSTNLKFALSFLFANVIDTT